MVSYNHLQSHTYSEGVFLSGPQAALGLHPGILANPDSGFVKIWYCPNLAVLGFPCTTPVVYLVMLWGAMVLGVGIRHKLPNYHGPQASPILWTRPPEEKEVVWIWSPQLNLKWREGGFGLWWAKPLGKEEEVTAPNRAFHEGLPVKRHNNTMLYWDSRWIQRH